MLFALITNSTRAYAWGATGAISELLGRVPTGAPEAELWLGTHPASPAIQVGGGGELEELSGRLPFLLKILAAAAPLSLQVHPTLEQAAAGFAREEAAGIPRDADERSYRDESDKPELLYALTVMQALSGFRPTEQTRAELAPLADHPPVAALLTRLDSDAAIADTVSWLLVGGEGVAELVELLSGDAVRELEGEAWEAVRLIAAHHPGDAGIAISLLMNAVVLQPGEALYLPAGNLHAYLGGVGIELMAASDNVLRGGLTAKHVDVAELLSVLETAPISAPTILPVELGPGVSIFSPSDARFRLLVVDDAALRRGVQLPLEGPSIALALGGDVTLGEHGMPAGSAAYLDEGSVVAASGSGMLVIASGVIPDPVTDPAADSTIGGAADPGAIPDSEPDTRDGAS